MLLGDGRLGLLDFGSVGRLDAGLRGGLQNLLLALDRGDPAALRDGLLELVDRTGEIDEQRLERALGAATGLMAVLLLTGSGGPRIAADLTLHQVFGYNLLVISALAGLRLLFVVFRRSGRASRSTR